MPNWQGSSKIWADPSPDEPGSSKMWVVLFRENSKKLKFKK